jgi:REP element-mobilizing transposase RayT
MAYDPDKPDRRSIRLRGYDYRRAGAYFVTICAQERQYLFGQVEDGAMRLNEAGRMVERWWHELERKFPGIETDAFVVMPNHIHGIIAITDANMRDADDVIDENAPVQADLDIRPPRIDDEPDARGDANDAARVDIIANINAGGYADPPLPNDFDDYEVHNAINENAPVGADLDIRPPRSDAEVGAGGVHSVANANDPRVRFNVSLSDIVQWFKIMTTNEYIRGVKQSGWRPFRKRVWQRSYYERIIRDDESLARIRDYIADNPVRWAEDDENLQKRTTP